MPDAQIIGLIFLGVLVFLGMVLWISARRRRWLVENGVQTVGVVLDTQYRRGSEGGSSWWSQVRFVDGDGIERERWLGGRYSGEVAVVHHPKRWKRAVIAEGQVVESRPGWVRRISIVFVALFFLSFAVAGVALSTGLWSPHIGEPDLAAICAGSGVVQMTDYRDAPIPRQVVGFDMASGSAVDVGLPEGLNWDTRQDPWDAKLVLCMERVHRSLVRTCDYRTRKLNLYDADYSLTLRSAHTGQTLATDTWSSTITRACPFVVRFSDSDGNVKLSYGTELPGIIGFLRPYVEQG